MIKKFCDLCGEELNESYANIVNGNLDKSISHSKLDVDTKLNIKLYNDITGFVFSYDICNECIHKCLI